MERYYRCKNDLYELATSCERKFSDGPTNTTFFLYLLTPQTHLANKWTKYSHMVSSGSFWFPLSSLGFFSNQIIGKSYKFINSQIDWDQNKPSFDVKTPLLYKNVCHTLLFLLFSKSKNTSKIMSELKPWMHNFLKSIFLLLKQTSLR